MSSGLAGFLLSEEVPPNTITLDILCSNFYSDSKAVIKSYCLKRRYLRQNNYLKIPLLKTLSRVLKTPGLMMATWALIALNHRIFLAW